MRMADAILFFAQCPPNIPKRAPTDVNPLLMEGSKMLLYNKQFNYNHMVVKRKSETIEVVNGISVHLSDTFETPENMKKAIDEARSAYEDNPTLPNKLDLLYADAEYAFASGAREDAVKRLKTELDAIREIPGSPEFLLKWMDTQTLLAEMLIRLKRPEEAYSYAETVLDIADKHFPDTLEQVYAEELYAAVCALVGETDEAEAYYKDALSRLKGEISSAESLKDNIEATLKSLEK